ncbi:MAG: DUF3667 domain-containing protein [Muribaculaceae bacterium]|nr:DUF3667 domain-containing protein [Muribaculaceae bacterium]
MSLIDVITELVVLMHHPRANSNEISDQEQHCVNCGHEYKGNFCPACGQKATAGRITWNTVRCGVMDVWGLGSRSLVKSLWNLIVRPGRFISDYINGKWQVSFPPVKMLVIVAVSLYFIGRLVYPEFWVDLFDEGGEGSANVFEEVLFWVVSHPEWAFLFLLSNLIIPTWFVFRHAPRNTRHTLPQGFFIQVFMCVQFYLWLFVLSSIFKIFDTGEDLGLTVSFVIVLPLLLFIDYKALFGYGWWGTLWRVVTVFELAYIGLAILVFSSVLSDSLFLSTEGASTLKILSIILFMVLAAALLISIVGMINRRPWRTAGWLKVLRNPLILLGVMLAMLIICELTRPGSLFNFLRFLLV